MNTIKSEWEMFESMVLRGVSDQQRREAHLAFYAGVVSLLEMQHRIANTITSEAGRLAVVEAWKRELEYFRAEQTTKAVLAMAQMRH